MTDEAKLAAITVALTGVFIAIGSCILFGILDIQCKDSRHGRYWNAEKADVSGEGSWSQP